MSTHTPSIAATFGRMCADESPKPDPWFEAVTDVVFGDPRPLARMRRAMQQRDDTELGRLLREAVDEALAVNAGQLAADRAEGIA